MPWRVRVSLGGGAVGGWRRWFGCVWGGYLTGSEESLGLWGGQLEGLGERGYGLFPGVKLEELG